MPKLTYRDPISGRLVTVWVSEDEYEEIMEEEDEDES